MNLKGTKTEKNLQTAFAGVRLAVLPSTSVHIR